jgi:hypothetical protein
MRRCSRLICAAASVTVALMTATIPAHAQETAGDTARAIKELTTEVRGLRAVIEHSAQSQLQSQVLGLYLNLQQNRVTQATARMDDVRRELEGVSGRTRELAQQATALEGRLAEEADPVKRREIERAQAATKQEAEGAAAHEQQVKQREIDAYQVVQTEEARWTDLISRLEQLLKK